MTERYCYARRHTGGAPLEFLGFASRSDRDAWVDQGWGRLPYKADDAPSGASRGLPWSEEEVYLADGRTITVGVYAP